MHECPVNNCIGVMEMKVTIYSGDSEGRGSVYIYQCPICKTIEEVSE